MTGQLLLNILKFPFVFLYQLTGVNNHSNASLKGERLSSFLLICFFVGLIMLNIKALGWFTTSEESVKDLQLHLFVAGVFGFIFIITMIQYAFFRDSTYLFYSFYLLLNLSYFTFSFIRYIIPKTDLPNNLLYIVNALNIPVLVLSYAVYTMFSIRFLDIQHNQTNLFRWLRIFCTFYLLLLGVYVICFFALRYAQAAYYVYAFILIACMPVGLASIILVYKKQKNNIAAILCIGSTCFLIGSILGFIFADKSNLQFQSFPFNRWIFFTKLGTLLEIILFSSSFTYRIKMMEQEKQKAQADLLMQLQENEDKSKKLQTIRDNIAKDLHDEIGSTLTSIKILAQVSYNNLQKNPEKAADMIAKITEQSTHMQQGMSDIVWAIAPHNDKLEKIVIRMREYISQTLEVKNIRTTFLIEENVLSKRLAMDQRKDFFLMFKEAVNNVVKYANAQTVRIEIKEVNHIIQMSIEDDGIGFDDSRITSSNGLKNMRTRALALNGHMEISSVLGKGTIILFHLSPT